MCANKLDNYPLKCKRSECQSYCTGCVGCPQLEKKVKPEQIEWDSKRIERVENACCEGKIFAEENFRGLQILAQKQQMDVPLSEEARTKQQFISALSDKFRP